MLKKASLMAILIPICLGLGHPAIADEPQSSTVGEESFLSSVFKPHFGRDFSASVGVKTWFNKWNYPLFSIREKESEPELVTSYLSDAKQTPIPVLSFRYKNLFVSGSYFPKTDYDFGSQWIDVPFYIPPEDNGTIYFDETIGESGDLVIIDPKVQLKIPVKFSPEANRSEWDINMGYFIHPFLAVSVGYKKIKRHAAFNYQIPPIDYVLANFAGSGEPELDTLPSKEFSLTQNDETKGFTLGIASVVPLQGRFGLYGNFAVGWLETKGEAITYDTDYYLGEVGFLYSHKLESIAVLHAASIHLGYRFQSMHEDIPVDTIKGDTDSTDGFVLGVNLSF